MNELLTLLAQQNPADVQRMMHRLQQIQQETGANKSAETAPPTAQAPVRAADAGQIKRDKR